MAELKIYIHDDDETTYTDTPSVKKLKKLLNNLPIGKLYAGRKLAQLAGISYYTFKIEGCRFKDYRVMLGKKYFYGNKKTIKYLLGKEKLKNE